MGVGWRHAVCSHVRGNAGEPRRDFATLAGQRKVDQRRGVIPSLSSQDTLTFVALFKTGSIGQEWAVGHVRKSGDWN